MTGYQAQKKRVRVLIADDHPMMCMGIRDVLSTSKNIEVVGEAMSCQDAIAKAKERYPDILLLDISMPDISGIVAANILRQELPDVKVILLSMHDEKEYIEQFLKSGAHAYVLKSSPPGEIIQAIEAVQNGGAFFSPPISRVLLEHKQAMDNGTVSHDDLTPRELQVLALLVNGQSSKQIAHALHISVRTVAKYRETLMRKLDRHTVAELIQYAISKKIVEIRTS